MGRILAYLKRHGRLPRWRSQGLVQVDGGLEFMAEFEQECQKRAIRLLLLPPRSPKLNGRAERAHRTQVEEY